MVQGYGERQETNDSSRNVPINHPEIPRNGDDRSPHSLADRKSSRQASRGLIENRPVKDPRQQALANIESKQNMEKTIYDNETYGVLASSTASI